jgi:type IV conjugative transfer system protein TraE
MKSNFAITKNDVLIQQRNVMVLVCGCLLLLSLILSVCLLKKDTTTILVPNTFNSSISISHKIPSNDYLEAMSRDVIYTMFNLTPDNINYAEKSILSFVHSSSYGIVKSQMNLIKDTITSKKFSTAFYPNSMYPDNTTLSVVVDGTLYTYLGAKEVAKEKKSYEIKYDYTSSKLTLLGIEEVVEDDNNKKSKGGKGGN